MSGLMMSSRKEPAKRAAPKPISGGDMKVRALKQHEKKQAESE